MEFYKSDWYLYAKETIKETFRIKKQKNFLIIYRISFSLEDDLNLCLQSTFNLKQYDVLLQENKYELLEINSTNIILLIR